MIPQIYSHYRHKYGGIYVIKGISENTVDKSQWVVYNHIWPFDEKMYHRPIEEWTEDRFKQLSVDEFICVLGRDRETFQAEIIATREAARGK